MTVQAAEVAELALEGETRGGQSPTQEALRRMLRSPVAIVGLALIAVFVVVALAAPLIAPYSPRVADLTDIRPGQIPGPSGAHLLGLDQLGRDELSRLVYGARYSLLVGVVSLAIGVSVGLVVGALAGGIGGWLDSVLMRLMDIMLAIPGLLFAIGIAALLGPSLRSVMIAVAVPNMPIFARLLRGSMLSQREADYVLAARSLGVRRGRIVTRHILPNSLSSVIVAATLALGTAIIDAAGLAFLGLGSADPAVPEWGRMLSEAQSLLSVAPRLAFLPGAAILVAALGFNLVGDALREALDPKLRR